MRVTESMRVAHAMEATRQTSARLLRASLVASSGLEVNAPSDDPARFDRGARIDARIDLQRARAKTASVAAGDLELAESALAHASDVITRARALAVQLSNGSIDPKTRANAANEARSLRDELVSIANTKGAVGYIFAGHQTGAPPFDPSGAFLGDSGEREVELADGKTARASASGALAFTASGGRDIFADLTAFATALANDNVPQITAAIGRMDEANTQLTAARASAGLDAERLRTSSAMMEDLNVLLEGQRGTEADSVGAFTELAEARAAYERAIEVTKQILAQGAQR